MRKSVHILSALFMAVSAAFGTAVSAQQIHDEGGNYSPSDVFQSVDDINILLAAFHDANGSSPKLDKNAPVLAQRLPRHVYQKAREVFEKVQLLRMINGLQENPEPPFPAGEIGPGDVHGMAMAILAEVEALRGAFGVNASMTPARLPSGKTPTDVYSLLVAAGLQVDGLGSRISCPMTSIELPWRSLTILKKSGRRAV